MLSMQLCWMVMLNQASSHAVQTECVLEVSHACQQLTPFQLQHGYFNFLYLARVSIIKVLSSFQTTSLLKCLWETLVPFSHILLSCIQEARRTFTVCTVKDAISSTVSCLAPRRKPNQIKPNQTRERFFMSEERPTNIITNILREIQIHQPIIKGATFSYRL